jgi:hypothetical protein
MTNFGAHAALFAANLAPSGAATTGHANLPTLKKKASKTAQTGIIRLARRQTRRSSPKTRIFRQTWPAAAYLT